MKLLRWVAGGALTAVGVQVAFTAIRLRVWYPDVMVLPLLFLGGIGILTDRRWARLFVYPLALVLTPALAYSFWEDRHSVNVGSYGEALLMVVVLWVAVYVCARRPSSARV